MGDEQTSLFQLFLQQGNTCERQHQKKSLHSGCKQNLAQATTKSDPWQDIQVSGFVAAK